MEWLDPLDAAMMTAGALSRPLNGSSRHSPRNRYVAKVSNRAGLATPLFDLLAPAEGRNRANVFDIELLAGRLVDVTRWRTSWRRPC
jgi:hypothetical protein